MRYPFRVVIVTLLSLLLLVPAAAIAAKGPKAGTAVPTFVEETETAGIDNVYGGGFEFFVGGGVAVFDCDANGRPDLYFAGGENPASLYRNLSPIGGPLAFEQVTNPSTDLTLVTGAYPLDIDADGPMDLAVLRRGENVLLRGTGDCTFKRANEAWGFDGGDGWTVAFSAKWEDGSALPTLAIGDYLTIAEPGEPPECAASSLFRTGVSGAKYDDAIALTPGHCTLSVLFSDWDRSGRRDLRMTNDRHYNVDGEDQLWRVEPGELPRTWTREEGWQRLRVWGMGIASQDITGDGYPEIFVTSMGDNKLQTLDEGPEQPHYGDIALKRRVTVHRPFAGGESLPSTAWHAEFDDVNNDGRVDLFVSKGNVDAMLDHATNDPSNLLLGKSDGSFKEAARSAGILNFERGRGAALVDLNLDGLLDLVEVDRSEPAHVWRNVGAGDAADPKPMGDWLAVELAQDGPNLNAIGSWIEVKVDGQKQTREVTVGGGHASGELGWTHLGLGDSGSVRVRVQWPDGEWTAWMPIDANRFSTIERGAAEPHPWQPSDD